ncbi:MAG: SurA N-terminal domain-containing protein [Pseudoxanthomonas sp.]
MLQNLRDKTSGWIATVVLGLLIIPFAFVGVSEYATGGSDNSLARVQAPPTWWQSAPSWWPLSLLWQHEDVSPEEFRNAFERERAQQRQVMGDNFDPREFESIDNKRKVLEQLIDQKSLQLVARRAGVKVGDEAVRASIAGEPAFQVDGKFDQSRYLSLLASQQPPLTPQRFEQQERDRLQLALLPLGVADSDFVTDKQVDQLLKLLGETRDVTLVLLAETPADEAPVSDDEIKAWYESHASAYRQPETVALEYVEIDAAKLPVTEAADEAALRKRYDAEKTRFVSPEQRLVSHILVADEAKAKSLAEQARAPGADFAALAKANSEDTGSKDNGGDLGWIEQNGAMVKPFEDAVFATQAGTVSEPVKSEFGWHVIQVREIKAGAGKSFEQVREELAREEADGTRDRAYNELAGKLTDETLKNPTALAPAAAAVGLPVQKTEPFTRGNAPGILANPAVLRQAFSEQLMEDGTVSDPIEIAPSHSVVIRVFEHTPEQAQPLAQVRDAVIAAVRADRQAKAAEKAADALLARLQKGESLKDIAAAEKLQSNDIPGLPRGAPMPTAEGNEAIFAAQPPAEGKPAIGKIALGGGRHALFAVTKVNAADLEKVTAEQRAQLRQQLMQVHVAASAQSFVEATRKQFKVVVHEDRLQ